MQSFFNWQKILTPVRSIERSDGLNCVGGPKAPGGSGGPDVYSSLNSIIYFEI